MSEIALARSLLAGLADRLGLESLLAEDEDTAVLQFDAAPTIHLCLDEQSGISLMAHIGDAPSTDVELVEELLASNLNWRDTDGATLAMERYTRGVFIARRWTVAELGDVHGLCTALEHFMLLAERWIQSFPQLGSAGSEEGGAAMPGSDFAALRG